MNDIPFFDRYTERARMVISLAEAEAQHFQQNALGTEHLLLGLIREGEGVPAQVLSSQGITLERLRKAVEETRRRGNTPMQGEIGFTPHAKTAMEMALKEAERQFPPRSTGTSTPLLGSIHLSEREAARMLQDGKLTPHLESLGITLEELRKAVSEAKGRGVQLLFDQTSPANTPTEEAERRQHPLFHVTPKHLLLGVLRVPESTGVKILQGLGMPPLKEVGRLLYLGQLSTLPLTYQEYAPRFTKQASKAWELAHEEARRLQDSFVGAHHLLLGLIGEGSGVAATILAQMGVDLEKMRKHVKPAYNTGDWNAPGDIKLQPRLKMVIEQASNEARRRSHPRIGTGHLLLGLVREHDDQGIVAGLLQMLGVDLDALRAVLRQALTERAGLAEQEAETPIDENSETGIYASNASIAAIERDLQGRELDKTILAAYPFSLEVRYVLEDARTAATNLAQRVGPEHLLLGLAALLFRGEGPVSQVLKDLGIDVARIRAAIESRQGQRGQATSVLLVHSALCRASLLLAADEAEARDGQGALIRNEHLLLALLREEKGIIADLLGDLGTSVETARTKLLEALKNSSSPKN